MKYSPAEIAELYPNQPTRSFWGLYQPLSQIPLIENGQMLEFETYEAAVNAAIERGMSEANVDKACAIIFTQTKPISSRPKGL